MPSVSGRRQGHFLFEGCVGRVHRRLGEALAVFDQVAGLGRFHDRLEGLHRPQLEGEAQLLLHAGILAHAGADRCQVLLGEAHHHRAVDVFLVREDEIKRGPRHPGLGGDVAHGHALEAVTEEDSVGGGDDLLSLRRLAFFADFLGGFPGVAIFLQHSAQDY
ncbi:MAG: hypothetical protein MO853_09140 [Candidatus Protistobacter heckmanni]|nr:hypothetical protein [Candidatus Protistobacter heckmanni]